MKSFNVLESGKVYVFHLSSGESVMGRFEDGPDQSSRDRFEVRPEHEYRIVRAYSIVRSVTGRNEITMALMPWLPLEDESVVLEPGDVIAYGIPSAGIMNQYLQLTTGLTIPDGPGSHGR